MEGVVWAALITGIVAIILAVLGWYLNRAHGLPSNIEKSIRDEQELYKQTLEAKVARMAEEITKEQEARAADKIECAEQLERLADAIIDRDAIITRLHARLGIPVPPMTEVRGSH